MLEKFKQFTIENMGLCKNSWEVRRYSPDGSTHIVLAFIRYENESFSIDSIGMRLLQYGTPDMNKWIIAWVEYQKVKRILEGE